MLCTDPAKRLRPASVRKFHHLGHQPRQPSVVTIARSGPSPQELFQWCFQPALDTPRASAPYPTAFPRKLRGAEIQNLWNGGRSSNIFSITIYNEASCIVGDGQHASEMGNQIKRPGCRWGAFAACSDLIRIEVIFSLRQKSNPDPSRSS